jgi:hypothetical protein
MRLHRFRFSGKIAIVTSANFPGFAGHRPAFHGGFCVSRWAVLHGRRVPANLPVGRDLTIRCKIENGRYYCAVGTRIESGHHVALNPRDPEATDAPLNCISALPPPASVTISGDCIGWRLWIEQARSIRLLAVRVTSRLDGRLPSPWQQ